MKKGEGQEAKFGELLRQLRTGAGMSQERLALECGLDRSFVSLMERGIRQPTLRTIFLLAAALGLRASEIVARLEEAER